MSDLAAPPDDSVIHDIGYRRYHGPRLGRGYATRSLFVHSLRTAYGIGRGFKAKIFPWSVAALVGLIAIVLTAIASQSGERVATYPEFVDYVGLLSTLFLAIVGPELVSRDLRARALTLYFSRPLRRADYVLAKLGALVAAVWLLLGAPQVVIFAGAAFDASGPGKVWREFTDLAAGLGYAGVYALVTGAIALLVASLSGRRAFAAAGIAAVFLVTLPIAGVLSVIGGESVRQLSGLVNPSILLQGIHRWLFDAEYGLDIGAFGPVYAATAVAIIAACTGLLVLRYRWVES